MQQIGGWSAKRAGGRITVSGRKAGPGTIMGTGDPVKVVGVDRIEPKNGKVIATDLNGVEYELVVTPFTG